MFSLLEAARHLNAELLYPAFPDHASGASLDTRTLLQGELFFALKGQNQDGHTHLAEAFQKGAAGAIIERQYYKANTALFSGPSGSFRNIMVLDNPGLALASLAAWHRSQLKIPFVGVTGSVGKTSTKEFLHYLLQKKWKGLATAGNFNNHLGLPLTLLRLNVSHEYCVAELGASHLGEIAQLAAILKPSAGIITQIAPCHLEGFGSLEGIYQTKLELFHALDSGCPAVLPDDDPVLLERAKTVKAALITVGFSETASYRVTELKAEEGQIRFKVNGKKFSFPGIAPFFARNAAMAIALAESLGFSLKQLPEDWEDFKLPSGRFQASSLGEGVQVIYDGYNASPGSFHKALEAFESFSGKGRKILVMADMLELGPDEIKYHQELGSSIAGRKLDLVVGYGALTAYAIQAVREKSRSMGAWHFSSALEAADFLLREVKSGDSLLLKASRGMKIETVLKRLSEKSEISKLAIH